MLTNNAIKITHSFVLLRDIALSFLRRRVLLPALDDCNIYKDKIRTLKKKKK